MVEIAQESLVATAMYFTNVKSHQEEAAANWKQTFIDVDKELNYQYKRLMDACTTAQLESKLWLVDEVEKLDIPLKQVGLLGGWYANYIVQLLVDRLAVKKVHNFEMDRDAKNISYKFNKRFKERGIYQCYVKNIMFSNFEPNLYDCFINTSCEHMYPMHGFHKLNENTINNPLFVLQSTDERYYDDHINPVWDAEELAEQGKIKKVLYSGTRRLNSGMNRFMVIGYKR
tara:strand:- start:82 stop:768 length:687 start_codon:yes stop_codon:yes gene_type:complete